MPACTYAARLSTIPSKFWCQKYLSSATKARLHLQSIEWPSSDFLAWLVIFHRCRLPSVLHHLKINGGHLNEALMVLVTIFKIFEEMRNGQVLQNVFSNSFRYKIMGPLSKK